MQELADLGVLKKEKQGRKTSYRLMLDSLSMGGLENAIDFYSESLPVGVAGSYLLDKLDRQKSTFRFKHHYPMRAIDSEVTLAILDTIQNRCIVEVTMQNPISGEIVCQNTPVKLYISAETGREYAAFWSHTENRFFLSRIDRIMEVKLLEEDPAWEQLSRDFSEHQAP